eukprot:TRINITY_DN5240_c0_g1_i1.p2 TRINITY_DN5240_c0_g1~~TRINITY_DN5240_c0_g1_i1.p2  ORF type:complete len:105 (+),score=56.35 TRINITY_DN5240_c0_g1_i1:87-401(+)
MAAPAKDKDQKEFLERKVQVLSVYMAEEEQQKAIEFAQAAVNQKEQSTDRDVAMYIKKEADKVLGPGRWHCVYGKSFGAFCTYEAMKYVHFMLGQHQILLWKHG